MMGKLPEEIFDVNFYCQEIVRYRLLRLYNPVGNKLDAGKSAQSMNTLRNTHAAFVIKAYQQGFTKTSTIQNDGIGDSMPTGNPRAQLMLHGE